MRLCERLRLAIEREGEVFTLSGNSYKGLFQLMESGKLRAFMDDVEIAGMTKPVLMLLVHQSVPLVANAAIVRDSRSYRVARIYTYRLRGVQSVKAAVLA